jgi:hypothetical protein
MVSQLSKPLRALLLCLGGLSLLSVSHAQQRFLTVGTGAVTGVYYAAGGAVCRLVNKERRDHGYRCTVESTGGSVANIQSLLSGDLDFGVIQSDALYAAIKGVRAFEGKPQSKLRAMFSLHPEPLTLVARKESNIRSLGDLRGKRVNVGNPGSGTRVSVDELMSAAGLRLSDFAITSELKADEHGAALCANRIDAFFYVVGHPSANVQDPMTACGATLVSITGPGVDRLVAAQPFYSHASIPARTYPTQATRFDTYGMLATMVTTADRSEEEVYVLTRSVFENLDEFRKLHPSFALLVPEKMRQAGLVAPLHPGALRYYREKGWAPTTKP